MSKIKLIFAAALLAFVLCFTACGQGDDPKNAEASKDSAGSSQSSAERAAYQAEITDGSSAPQKDGGSSAAAQPDSQVGDKDDKNSSQTSGDNNKNSSQTGENSASAQKSSAGAGAGENENRKTDSGASQNDNTEKTEPTAAPKTTAPQGSKKHGDNAEVRFDEL